MKLLIVRHADAGDKEEFAKSGKPDSLRPLSDKGRRQMRAAARDMQKLVPECGLILTSPYARAQQTAEILEELWGTPTEETASLTPGQPPSAFMECLARHSSSTLIAAVGHEPDLGVLATWLIAGADQSGMDLRKGAACLIVFEDSPRPGSGLLCWMIGPKELTKLR